MLYHRLCPHYVTDARHPSSSTHESTPVLSRPHPRHSPLNRWASTTSATLLAWRSVKWITTAPHLKLSVTGNLEPIYSGSEERLKVVAKITRAKCPTEVPSSCTPGHCRYPCHEIEDALPRTGALSPAWRESRQTVAKGRMRRWRRGCCPGRRRVC